MAEERSWSGLGELLLREGLITDSQLTTALQVKKETDKSLGRVLVEMGLITERVRMRLLQQKLDCEIVHISPQRIDRMVLDYLPKSIAVKHRLAPVRLDLDTLVVAMEDPTDVTVLDDLKAITGFRIRPAIATIGEIEAVLKEYPEKVEEKVEVEVPLSLWFRIVGDLILFVLLAVPFLVFSLLVLTDLLPPGWISYFARPGAGFDVFLFTLIGYGIYAVICFEIWSLIFQPRRTKPPGPPVPPSGLL